MCLHFPAWHVTFDEQVFPFSSSCHTNTTAHGFPHNLLGQVAKPGVSFACTPITHVNPHGGHLTHANFSPAPSPAVSSSAWSLPFAQASTPSSPLTICTSHIYVQDRNHILKIYVDIMITMVYNIKGSPLTLRACTCAYIDQYVR
jgi:hypothetical protein